MKKLYKESYENKTREEKIQQNWDIIAKARKRIDKKFEERKSLEEELTNEEFAIESERIDESINENIDDMILAIEDILKLDEE